MIPKAFDKKIGDNIHLAQSWVENIKCTKEIKVTIIELVTTFFEHRPSKAVKFISEYLRFIMDLLISFQVEEDEDWNFPKTHEAVVSEEQEIMEAMNSVDRVFNVAERKIALPKLSEFLIEKTKSDNWKTIRSCLSCISQIGEHCEHFEDAQNYLQLSINFIEHENPKVRYSVYHVIGQFADDFQGKMQEKTH
jgi:hypothetical protein